MEILLLLDSAPSFLIPRPHLYQHTEQGHGPCVNTVLWHRILVTKFYWSSGLTQITFHK